MSAHNLIAIVTGASSGLGEAIVSELLKRDYLVYGFSRSGLDLDHPAYTDVQGDIRDEEAVSEFYSLISEQTSGIDLLVNNAGICEMTALDELELNDFANILQTNTLGPFLMLKYLKQYLIQDQTHVVNVISTAAKYSYPNVASYCASKAAMKAMIESVQKEWKALGVRFSNLYPGAIDTALWDKLNVHFSREKMLSVEDFLHVFNMVVDSDQQVQFPDITFMHTYGQLE
jgi:NAD(P)-dependent dehydrogenase (short-subunit alcohol dehydrogenase family)